MKLTKSLFLAFAGLGLFACSNEEVTDNGGVQGGADVTVTVNPQGLSRSRAIDPSNPVNGANGDKQDVYLKKGDYFATAVRDKNASSTNPVDNWFYSSTGTEAYSIAAQRGGLIQVDGAN